MSSLSTSSSISRTDIFDIPVEMKLEIFGYLSLTGMSAIIAASPTMLRCFKINEQRILKRHKDEIGDFYQSLPNMLLAYHVGRLYRIRERHRFDTQEVVETQVRPVLNEIMKMNFAKQWDEPGLTPVQLRIAQNLEPFINKAFMMCRRSDYLKDRDIKKAREVYIESFLRYECHTKIFYHNGGFLFTGTFDILDTIRGQIPPREWQKCYRFGLRYQFLDLVHIIRVYPQADILGIERDSKVVRQYKMHLMMQGYSFLGHLDRLSRRPTNLNRELLDSLSDFKKNNSWADYDFLYTVWPIWLELREWVKTRWDVER